METRRPRRADARVQRRCSAVASGLAKAAVTPRPIAAGVFGIARTTAPARGRRALRLAIVLPARIDRTSVRSSARGAIRGAVRVEALRLDREHKHVRRRRFRRIERDAARRRERARSPRTDWVRGSSATTARGRPRASPAPSRRPFCPPRPERGAPAIASLSSSFSSQPLGGTLLWRSAFLHVARAAPAPHTRLSRGSPCERRGGATAVDLAALVRLKKRKVWPNRAGQAARLWVRAREWLQRSTFVKPS